MDNTLNYSSFDFESLKDDMIINMKANGIFKDYNFDGANITQLIELFAGIGDLLNFYINMVADESFLRTADIYENINKIVELIGYNPGGPKSSEVTINISAIFNSSKTDNYFTIPNIPTTDQPITTLTATSVSEDGLPIKYTPTSSITFVAISGSNTFSADVNLVQGEYKSTKFDGTGQQFQKFIIDDLDAIEEYIIVRVGGLEWTKVSNIYTEGADKIYSTRYGKDKKIEIQFGNGVFGQIPYAGAENIEVWYIQSMNLKGAIGANEITKLDYDLYLIDVDNGSNDGSALSFTITQPEASIGHNVPMSEEEIRNLAPKQFRTQNRLVTKNDHEDLILSELGNFVSQVIALNKDEYYSTGTWDVSGTWHSDFTDDTIVSEISGFNYNNIYLYILPKYGYEVNSTLKSRILDFLDEHKLLTLNYVFKDLDYRYVNFNISYKKNPTTLQTLTQIETDIYNILKTYFSKTNMKIGGVIKYSNLLKELTAVEGTSSLTLAVSSDLDTGWKYENINFGWIQFPIINTSGLTISYSGEEL